MLCSQRHNARTRSLRHNTGLFHDAINRFDQFAQEHLVRQPWFAFVTLDSWDLRCPAAVRLATRRRPSPAALAHLRPAHRVPRWRAPAPVALRLKRLDQLVCACQELSLSILGSPSSTAPFHLQAWLRLASSCHGGGRHLPRVLRGLIRNLSPSRSTPIFSTRPMDAPFRWRVLSCLKHVSRVLHMKRPSSRHHSESHVVGSSIQW